MRNDTRTDKANEQIFDMKRLQAEARCRDRDRARAAIFATGALKILVNLRAAAEGTSFADTWKHIFETKRLHAEIEGEEGERRRAALRVIEEVNHIKTLRSIARGERPCLSREEQRRWVERVANNLERLKRLNCGPGSMPLHLAN